MDALPYYKWLWIDYRANRKVQRMSWQAKGLYRELLDEFWSEGFLPNDPAALADICGCPHREFVKHWPQILPCFDETDRGLVNPKMDEQRTAKDRERAAKARAGAGGGKISNSHTRSKQVLASAKQVLEGDKQVQAQPDIAEQEHKQSRAEQEQEQRVRKEDVSTTIVEIILVHPRAQLVSMTELDIRPKDTVAVLQAVDAEVERAGVTRTQAAEMIRDRTKAISGGVPKEEWRFIKPIDEFMRDRHYRLEPKDLTRGGSNGVNSSNQHGQRVSPAAQRGIDSRDHIREAVARRLGHDFGKPDGRDAGELAEAGATPRDPGNVAGEVGGDGSEVRNGDIRGVVIEATPAGMDARAPRH